MLLYPVMLLLFVCCLLLLLFKKKSYPLVGVPLVQYLLFAGFA